MTENKSASSLKKFGKGKTDDLEPKLCQWTLIVLKNEKYTISFLLESCFFFFQENVTGKIAHNPAIAHNFLVPKLCANKRFYCT